MNDRGIQVLEQYDIEIEKTRKGRGALLADTREGSFRLAEYHGSVGRLIYEEELTNYLADNGILVNAIVRNKENSLFTADQAGVKYVLTRHFSGAECDVRNRNDMYEAVKLMARLHNFTKEMQFENLEYVPVLTDSLEEIKRHNRELKRIRNYIRGKTRKSEFEYDILEHFEEFYEQAQTAEKKLTESGYQEENKRAIESGAVCHGNYNYHNIIRVDNQLAVINFEHSGRGILIRDLYFFIRKVMEKHDWNQSFGVGLLENYDKIRRISPKEQEILKLLLLYPEKFWKVLNHYYNKNKAYLPDQMKEKMKKVYQQQKNKSNFTFSLL